MPTTTLIGDERSKANKSLGGTPIVHYLDLRSRGRGQVIRLLLIDARVSFKDVRYTLEEWPKYKASDFIVNMSPARYLPIVQMPDGRSLTQSYSIVRHLGRLLGGYDGKTEDERYRADLICDMVVDWRTLFAEAFFSNDKENDYEKHKRGTRVRYLNAIEKHLTDWTNNQNGPYITGNGITYADLELYQILHDEDLLLNDSEELASYYRLTSLAVAVAGRPNIKKYLQSSHYLG